MKTMQCKWVTAPRLAGSASLIAICGLYLVGGAASNRIPFGPPIHLISVLRQLRWSDLPSGNSPFYLFLAAAVAAAVIYAISKERKVRRLAMVGGLLLPLLWMGWSIKGFAAWLLAIPYAAVFSLTALTGEADGEFYNEGTLVYAAIGWWLLYCVVLLCRDRLAARATPQRDSPLESLQSRTSG